MTVRVSSKEKSKKSRHREVSEPYSVLDAMDFKNSRRLKEQ